MLDRRSALLLLTATASVPATAWARAVPNRMLDQAVGNSEIRIKRKQAESFDMRPLDSRGCQECKHGRSAGGRKRMSAKNKPGRPKWLIPD